MEEVRYQGPALSSPYPLPSEAELKEYIRWMGSETTFFYVLPLLTPANPSRYLLVHSELQPEYTVIGYLNAVLGELPSRFQSKADFPPARN